VEVGPRIVHPGAEAEVEVLVGGVAGNLAVHQWQGTTRPPGTPRHPGGPVPPVVPCTHRTHKEQRTEMPTGYYGEYLTLAFFAGAFVEMIILIGFLALGLAYGWRKKVLEWL